ncbi:MAG: hypothetical protein AB1439_08720 [candidate division FCPU426 bacterium]
MPKRPVKKKIVLQQPDDEPWLNPDEIKRREDIIRDQRQVAAEFIQAAHRQPKIISKLLLGLLEIVDFMFKNTCGVGSSYRLTTCRLEALTQDDIRGYYRLLLTALAYHFRTLMPKTGESLWQAAVAMTGDPAGCEEISRELAACLDQTDGSYSPVQAGHRLWQRVRGIMHVEEDREDPTARIYYQTAPGQNLLFVVERANEEGWLKKD